MEGKLRHGAGDRLPQAYTVVSRGPGPCSQSRASGSSPCQAPLTVCPPLPEAHGCWCLVSCTWQNGAPPRAPPDDVQSTGGGFGMFW